MPAAGLLPTLILVPLLGGVVALVLPRRAAALGLTVSLVTLAIAVAVSVAASGAATLQHAVGAWEAPLGIVLRADGLSLLMVLMTCVVGLAVSCYAAAYFEGRRGAGFWPVWLLLLGSLCALFLSADLFNLYVTLELVGIAAVALTALGERRATLLAALRYLVASLLGSLAYLLGVALLYHDWGTVDLALLAEVMAPRPASIAACALMTTGLALKAALFPLHFWLPPAHGGAAAPVSALLSGLVVKASFYLCLRLWMDLFPAVGGGADAILLTLASAAILWGSTQALLQTRAKLLIAYSTVSQVGYLFLAVPLARESGAMALQGLVLLALAHALAKAALFMAAGNLMASAGHDRIADLDGAIRHLPLSAGTLALAGVSIMGLPPSGGFSGKWLLLQAAIEQDRWPLVAVMLLGGLLAAAYVFKLLEHAFAPGRPDAALEPVAAAMQWPPFLLALGAVLLGFAGPWALDLLAVGAAAAAR